MADGSVAKNNEHKGGHGGGRLTLYIVIGIVAAIVLALIAPAVAASVNIGGEIFLRLLQMVVVPLVMASVMSGILRLGDIRKLGRPGSYAVAYYLTTTILAVGTGLVVVNIVDPGVGIKKELVEDARKEGNETVSHARDAHAAKPKQVTWGDGKKSLTAAGESEPVTLPVDEAWDAVIRFNQRENAASSAQIVLETSADRKKFTELKVFQAEKEAGEYQYRVAIPAGTVQVRFSYTPPAGAAGEVSAEIAPGPPSIFVILKSLVLMLFTNNLLGSMVEVQLLPLIVFSIVFAGMLTTLGSRSEPIANLLFSIDDALMQFVLLLMKLAPIGIFCLVAARFGKAQLEGQFLELLKVQGKYMLTVIIGLAIHALVTLPLILWLFTRRNPFRFVMQMSQAILTAFSTASSTATLPITMECAERNAGISRKSTEFVVPLGATINMDGTALYEAAAAIFIAQAFSAVDPNFQLTLMQQLTVAVTATLAAIGAAGIPEAGLVTMLIVLNAVGLPLEMIGLILPVDWLLDRFRTAVNAYGDSVGAAVVERSFGET